MKSFDRDNYKKYIGKWCLYRHSYNKEYEMIFVAAIRDGIVKYSTDKIHWSYCDMDDFLGYLYFFVSPIDNDEDDDIAVIKVISNKDIEWKEYNPLDNPTNIGGSIKSNCPNCEHEWMETILTSYPPIYQRTCKNAESSIIFLDKAFHLKSVISVQIGLMDRFEDM